MFIVLICTEIKTKGNGLIGLNQYAVVCVSGHVNVPFK